MVTHTLLQCPLNSEGMYGSREVAIIVARHTIFIISLYNVGDFVIVEPIEEGVRVQAEIVHILYPKQIKELVKDGIW